MDDAERRAIADAEAAELAGDVEAAAESHASEGSDGE
jgi:DNA-directed RNA polymerase subunit beta'